MAIGYFVCTLVEVFMATTHDLSQRYKSTIVRDCTCRRICLPATAAASYPAFQRVPSGLGLGVRLLCCDYNTISWNYVSSGNAMIVGSTTSCIVALTWAGSQYPWSSARVLLPLIIGLLGLVASLSYEVFASVHPSVCFCLFPKYLKLIICRIDSIEYRFKPNQFEWVWTPWSPY